MSLNDLKEAVGHLSLPELLELMREVADQVELAAMELIGGDEQNEISKQQ